MPFELQYSSLVDQERLALCSYVQATSAIAARLATAGWVCRILYNAVIDRRIPFAVAVEYLLALSKTRRDKTPLPPELEWSDRFLPLPNAQSLFKELTALRIAHEELRDIPVSMAREAIERACDAVSAHVGRCIRVKREGKGPPKLRFRSAGQPISVTTSDFTLRRTGDDAPQARMKPGGWAKPSQVRNVERRAAFKVKREADWASRKLAAGWKKAKVEAGLEKRRLRHEKDRFRHATYDAFWRLRAADEDEAKALRATETGSVPEKRIRSDSPLAVRGEWKLNLRVQGIGTCRIRLSRPIPDGATVKTVTLIKDARHGAPIEVRLSICRPAAIPAFDPLVTGAAIHAAVRHLAPNAAPLTFVETVRAAGIPVRGDDSNISAPSYDDAGRATKPVKRPRGEVAADIALRKSLSRKDTCAEKAAAAKAAAVQASKADSVVMAVPDPSESVVPALTSTPSRKRRAKRSNRARKVRLAIVRLDRKQAARSETRAFQDAAALVRHAREGRPLPCLVATDPARMVPPLLAKGGPAERRAAFAAVVATGVTVPTSPGQALHADGRGAVMSPANRRRMRANLHHVRIGLRVKRAGVLCARNGAIHATPGHEGTTRKCCACEADVPKGIGDRIHACPACGYTAPRDMNSAVNTLGRALREYREDPDPGGRMMAERAAKAKRDAASAAPGAARPELEGVVALGSPLGAEHQEACGLPQNQTDPLPRSANVSLVNQVNRARLDDLRLDDLNGLTVNIPTCKRDSKRTAANSARLTVESLATYVRNRKPVMQDMNNESGKAISARPSPAEFSGLSTPVIPKSACWTTSSTRCFSAAPSREISPSPRSITTTAKPISRTSRRP